MDRNEDTARLVDIIYDSATDGDGWKTCFDVLCSKTGSMGAVFCSLTDPTNAIVTPSLRDANAAYRQRWHTQDVFMARAVADPARPSIVRHDHYDDVIDRSSHPFFQKFLEPRGLGAFLAFFTPSIFGAKFVLSVQRSLSAGPFTKDEIEAFEQLAPHAARALAIAGQLTFANSRDTALLSILDKLTYGAVIMNRDGKIAAMNEAATKMLDDGLALVDGALLETFSNPRGTVMHLLKLAFDDVPGDRTALVHRPSGRKPIVLQVLAFPKTMMAWGVAQRSHTVLLMLIDTELSGALSQMSVVQSFGLTSAEAKVAALVGSGISPIDAAEQLGSAAGTVRVQLKNVFNKLDIKRQSELVRLMAKLEVLGS